MNDQATELSTLPERTEERGLEKTTTAAVAAQAKAAIESRYLMALQRPRSWDKVRLGILDACKRPVFAESARYQKPIGGTKIIGPSIRFAEEAIRAMGNVVVESMAIYDDDKQRVVRVTVTDLEGNVSYPHDIVLNKTIERKTVRSGQEVLSSRTNTKGDVVYIIAATEDDLLVKQNAFTSKAIRNAALRLLPSDILEEAMESVAEVVKSRDKTNPGEARKRVIDLFHQRGIGPEDLENYLRHPIAQMTNAELEMLRQIYTAIKEGETTWGDVMDPTLTGNGKEEQGFTKARTQERTDELKEKLGVKNGKNGDEAKTPAEQVQQMDLTAEQQEEKRIQEDEKRMAADKDAGK